MTQGAAPSRPVTLAEVAIAAGVSKSTASKALSGRYDVQSATRERVVAAAARLGFMPSAIARNLSTGRTGTVGVLTNDLEGRFVIPILSGAEDALGAGEISVILCDARGDAVREQRQLRTLLERRIDGLIVVGGARTEPRASLGRNLPVPVVYAYAPSADPEDVSVVVDNAQAGSVAAAHLWEMGRRKIAFVGGDPTYVANYERQAGARAALAARGGELLTSETSNGSWTERWGRGVTARLLAEHPDLDAIIGASDMLARSALDVLRDHGRPVPDDVAVVGFDNWTTIATNTRPELTSVDLGLEALGRRAAELVFAALNGGAASPGVELRPVRLVVRDSTQSDR